jgi:hypothetical protein
MTTPELIRKFQSALPTVREWVESTLAANQNRAFPVSRMDYPRLGNVFPPELLNRARVRVVRDKPPFPPLSRMGLPELASFEAMPIAGITYQDTFFVTHGQQTESLCFHEIVHVVQWDQLGVENFLLAYGVGLMQFGYRDSPLEAMAYALQGGFDRGVLPGDLMGRIRRDTDAVWHDISERFAMDQH